MSIAKDLEKIAAKVRELERGKLEAEEDARRARAHNRETLDPLNSRVNQLAEDLKRAEESRKKAQEEAAVIKGELDLMDMVLSKAVARMGKAGIKFDADAERVKLQEAEKKAEIEKN